MNLKITEKIPSSFSDPTGTNPEGSVKRIFGPIGVGQKCSSVGGDNFALPRKQPPAQPFSPPQKLNLNLLALQHTTCDNVPRFPSEAILTLQ
jgi:hypothetical protein